MEYAGSHGHYRARTPAELEELKKKKLDSGSELQKADIERLVDQSFTAACTTLEQLIVGMYGEESGLKHFRSSARSFDSQHEVVDGGGRTSASKSESTSKEAEEGLDMNDQSRRLAHSVTPPGLIDVDFISIDIEGGELEILEDFPFHYFFIRVFVIEVDPTHAFKIDIVMYNAGYKKTALLGKDHMWSG